MIKKTDNIPGNLVESCIATQYYIATQFQYIFEEQKQTLPSPKTRVRDITLGEFYEFCIVVGDF